MSHTPCYLFSFSFYGREPATRIQFKINFCDTVAGSNNLSDCMLQPFQDWKMQFVVNMVSQLEWSEKDADVYESH